MSVIFASNIVSWPWFNLTQNLKLIGWENLSLEYLWYMMIYIWAECSQFLFFLFFSYLFILFFCDKCDEHNQEHQKLNVWPCALTQWCGVWAASPYPQSGIRYHHYIQRNLNLGFELFTPTSFVMEPMMLIKGLLASWKGNINFYWVICWISTWKGKWEGNW